MPTVQVRDFPERLFSQLQDAAAREHRSVPQQVIAITEFYVDGGGKGSGAGKAHSAEASADADIRRREELFARLRNAEPACAIPDGFPRVADLIREDREGR